MAGLPASEDVLTWSLPAQACSHGDSGRWRRGRRLELAGAAAGTGLFVRPMAQSARVDLAGDDDEGARRWRCEGDGG
jgi:hypothetical protein